MFHAQNEMKMYSTCEGQGQWLSPKYENEANRAAATAAAGSLDFTENSQITKRKNENLVNCKTHELIIQLVAVAHVLNCQEVRRKSFLRKEN